MPVWAHVVPEAGCGFELEHHIIECLWYYYILIKIKSIQYGSAWKFSFISSLWIKWQLENGTIHLISTMISPTHDYSSSSWNPVKRTLITILIIRSSNNLFEESSSFKNQTLSPGNLQRRISFLFIRIEKTLVKIKCKSFTREFNSLWIQWRKSWAMILVSKSLLLSHWIRSKLISQLPNNKIIPRELFTIIYSCKLHRSSPWL